MTTATSSANQPARSVEPPVVILLRPTPARLSIDELPDPNKLYLKKEFVHDRFPDQRIQLIEQEGLDIAGCTSSERERIRREELVNGTSNNATPRSCHIFYINRPAINSPSGRSRGRDVVGDLGKEKKIVDQILQDEFSFTAPSVR